MKRFHVAFLCAAPLLLETACATRAPLAWRVERQMLVPPGRPRPIAWKTRIPCPSTEALVARLQGGRVVLEVKHELLPGMPAGWLADWAGRAEESGCVPAGGGDALAARVLNATPLELPLRHRVMHPNHARSGFVDLTTVNRLEVITPILREGASPDAGVLREGRVEAAFGGLTVTVETSPEVLGVETAWYQPINGGMEPVGPAPRRNLFAGVHARYWRMVYKADQSSVLVIADSHREVQSITDGLLRGEASCPRCIAVPRQVAVNPYLAVTVNGEEVRVGVGSPTLDSVIRAAGRKPEDVLGTLAIRKSFEGKMVPVVFEHTNPQVLQLVIEGNEMVEW